MIVKTKKTTYILKTKSVIAKRLIGGITYSYEYKIESYNHFINFISYIEYFNDTEFKALT